MSNYAEIKKEVGNYLSARTPLIVINSSERERVERMLRIIAKELGTEIYYYTDSRQVVQLNSSVAPVNADNDPIGYISEIFKKKRNTIFTIADVKRVSEDTMYTREIIDLLYLAKSSDSTLILITSDHVYQRIAQFGMIAKLDRPDSEERLAQIDVFIKKYGGRYTIDWDQEDRLRAAALLRGFSEIQIENILSNEIVANEGLYKKNIFRLNLQKDRLYSAVSTIQPVRVSRDLNVSGLDNLKNWLDEKKRIFFTPDDVLDKYGIEPPKGILLTGVPGCGKSYSAKMVAKEWELPLYRFDIGSVYDKWQGESERKMKEALEFIDNVSPCILWIDEIEKALAVSDGGNETSKRILGQFLFWLQESASRSFMVATANDITKLPSELFRKGRFSEIFFVDLPNRSERSEAIKQYAHKCLHCNLGNDQLEILTDKSEGFSFSEIEYAIKDIAEALLLYGQSSLNMGLIIEKFESIVPIEKRNSQQISAIKNWGKENAVAAGTAIGGNSQWLV